jgi:hypothetical protein
VRRHLVVWISLAALIAGTLAPPLAHALAMRAAGVVAADFCSVSGKLSDAAQRPIAPAQSDRHHPAGECPCCNATATPLAIADVARMTGLLAPPAVGAPIAAISSARALSPWRAIQPRAPPRFA